jgi:hypothetical protein
VVTRFRPRTEVERWQLQDRLALQLRGMDCPAAPRFFQGPGGRVGFTLRVGWRPPAHLVDALGDIDRPGPER